MSYTKTTWVTGDIVTAEKLNNLENGLSTVSNNIVIVNATMADEYWVLSKTWNEIHDAMIRGKIVIVIMIVDNNVYYGYVGCAEISEEGYYSYVIETFNETFYAETATSYPSTYRGPIN